MPRRPRWIDPFAAMERLRAFRAARPRTVPTSAPAVAVPGSWLGRAWRRLRRKLARLWWGAPRATDAAAEKAVLELQPMDYRNPPSENIGSAALPLAATAAAAAAAAYFVASWQARDPNAAAVAERVDAGFDATARSAVGPVTLDGDGPRGAGRRLEDQLPPAADPPRGAEPDAGGAVTADAVPGGPPEERLEDPEGGGDAGDGAGAAQASDDGDGGGDGGGGAGSVDPPLAPTASNASNAPPPGADGAGGGATPAVPPAAPTVPTDTNPLVPAAIAGAPATSPSNSGTTTPPAGPAAPGRPLPIPVIFAGSGAGVAPEVRGYEAETGRAVFAAALGGEFAGGVRVAAGDFTRDGYPDAVAAAASSGSGIVRVLDGKTGRVMAGPLGSLAAFDSVTAGGVSVAAADVDGDGTPDLVAAAVTVTGPEVRAFSGTDGRLIARFAVTGADFAGGLGVAAADLTGDGKAEVAVGAGPGAASVVRVYDPLRGVTIAGPLGEFRAFAGAGAGGGVEIGSDALAADVDADGTPDLAVGSGPGADPRVQVVSGRTGATLLDFVPYAADATGGVRVGLAYVTDDPFADVITGTGPGVPATVRVFDGRDGKQLPGAVGEYRPFGDSAGGVYVGASNDPVPEVLVASGTTNAVEGGTDGEFTLRRDSINLSSALTVYFSLSGTATGGADYASPGGSVTFAAYAATATVTIDAYDDSTADPNETVVLTLTPDSAYTIRSSERGSSFNTATLIITEPTALEPPAITAVSDDTGVSDTDRLTNDTTPTVSGTAPPYSGVTVSGDASGSGTADAGGNWSAALSGVSGDGVYTLTATATLGGQTSAPSGPFAFTLDTTPPVVTVNVIGAPSTYDTAPLVVVTATDLNGLAGTVALDVDLNGDSDFDDAGESDFAFGDVSTGYAGFANYAPLTPGVTVSFRARAVDRAGNEGASAAGATTSVAIGTSPTNWPAASATPSTRGGYNPGLGPGGLLSAGNVTVVHPLDVDQSPYWCGTCVDAILINSQEVEPVPSVQMVLQSDSAGELPDEVEGVLTVGGTVVGTVIWSGSDLDDLSPGGAWVFAMVPPATPSTGPLEYEFEVTLRFPTDPDVVRAVEGRTFAVDRSDSPYGAGASFANTDALVAVSASGAYPAGLLRLHGRGGWSFYQDTGSGTYAAPGGDGGTLQAIAGGWTYREANGSLRTFDSAGRQTVWASPDGADEVLYAYTGAGVGTAARLSSVTSPDGGVATFVYKSGGTGLLDTVTAPGGRVTTFTHSSGRLTQVEDPDGGTRDIGYDGSGRPTSTQYGAAAQTWGYDAYGLASAQAAAAGWTLKSADAAGLGAAATAGPNGALPATLTNGVGGTQLSWLDVEGWTLRSVGAGGAVERWDRDANHFVTRYEDPLHRVTTYTVDAAGRVLTEVRPDATRATWTYGTYGGLTRYVDYRGGVWTYTLDAYGRRLTATDPLAHTTTYAYADGRVRTVTDPLGRVVTTVYDAARRPIGALVGGAPTGTLAYDAAGNVVTVTDPLGNVTTTAYNGLGRPTAVTNPLGQTATVVYDEAGFVLRTIDALGRVTSFGYDASGHVVTAIEALGSGVERRTTAVYDAADRLSAVIDPLGRRTTFVSDAAGRLVATVDPLGHRTTAVYDVAGQLVATIDANGRATQYRYDPLGRPVATVDALGRTSTVVYDSNSNAVAAVDPLGHRATGVYDAADRLIAAIDPLGNATSYGYDAADQLVTVTDPRGNVTTTVYDARGRVSVSVDALGFRTTVGYDAADNAITVTDPRGNVTTAVYDPLHRMTAAIDALGNRSTAVFDAVGNAVAAIDARGNTTTAVYDELNRPVAVIGALGNRATSVFDAGDRLVAAVDPLGNVTSFVYDNADRWIATVDALGQRSTSVYDAVGNVIATVDALGNRTSYTVDALNRVVRSTDARGAVASVTFDAAGRMTTATDPNGNVTSYVYDDANRWIATIDALGNRTTAVYDAAGNTIASVDALGRTSTVVFDALNRASATLDALGNRSTFVYDPAGNVVAMVDALGRTTTGVFDAVNRQVATIDALGNATTSVFDAAGNAIAMIDARGNVTSWVYDALDRVSATIDALGNRSTTTFDAAGNVRAVTDPLNRTTTFGYDALLRQTATTDARGNVWTTQYDAVGRAVASIDPLGNRTTAVYDAVGNAVANVDAAGFRSTAVYDLAGNAVASIDPLNHRTTIAFDALNRAVTVTDALGGKTTAVYDAVGNVVASVDPLGRRTTAVFDALDRVVGRIDALGNRATAVYDSVGNVLASVDELGQRTTAVYDAADRAVAVIDALGNTTTSVYDPTGNRIAVIDALGHRTTTVFDALNRAVANVDALGNRATAVYDAAGQVVAAVDARGNRTTATFDAVGNVVAITDALGNVTTSVYDNADRRIATIDPVGRAVTTAYDPRGLAVSVVDSIGTIAQYEYDGARNTVAAIDGLGRRTTAVFDALDRQTATIDALGNRSTVVYDAVGNVVATRDALGRTTSYGYDALDRGATVTDALGFVATAIYDAVGNRVASVNPLGQVTSFGYDALDRRVTTTDPLGHTSTVVFDAAGRMVASVDPLGHTTSFGYDARGLHVTTTDPLGNVTTSGYDAAGNRTTTTDPRGNTTTAVFDALDRRVAMIDALGYRTTAVFDAVGRAVVAVDELAHTITATYDARGRRVSLTDPLGYTTTTTYDLANNAVAVTDPLGHTTTAVYDALDRVVAQIDPLGFATTVTFDAVGNRLALADASGNVTSWVYDALDRPVSETDPLGNTATSAYDPLGRLASQTDRLGRRRDFGFDAAGRLTSEGWYTGGSLVQTQAWTYDAADRMLTAQDPDGTYTLSYDAADRVTAVQEPFGLVLTMGYDAAGNRTLVQDSKGGVTTVAFDARNRQTSEATAGSGLSPTRFDYTYTARGAVATVTRYADLAGTTVSAASSHDYDAAGRETHIRHADGSNATLAEYTYTYDAADRLVSKIEDGVGTSYAYDAAGQLTADGAAAFGYDATGNRTNVGYVTGAGNRISTDGVSTYTHDANGNLTQSTVGAAGATWVYTYDHRNQLLTAAYSATSGGTVTQRVTFAYDAFGVRVGRAAWDGTTTTTERYGVDGWDPAKPMAIGVENFDTWAELDGSGALVERSTWGSAIDAAVARQDAGGVVEWYLSDRQQSVRAVVDNAGDVLATFAYSAFGVVTGGVAPDGFGYTGHEWDETLGMWLTPARAYDPFTGRFMQRDMLGFGAGDPNLYRYVGNGPTNSTDPSGLADPFDIRPSWLPDFIPTKDRFKQAVGQAATAVADVVTKPIEIIAPERQQQVVEAAGKVANQAVDAHFAASGEVADRLKPLRDKADRQIEDWIRDAMPKPPEPSPPDAEVKQIFIDAARDLARIIEEDRRQNPNPPEIDPDLKELGQRLLDAFREIRDTPTRPSVEGTFGPATPSESLIPWYGSLKDLIYALENEDYAAAALHGFFFVTDVFLLKALVGGFIKRAGLRVGRDVVWECIEQFGRHGLRDGVEIGGRAGRRPPVIVDWGDGVEVARPNPHRMNMLPEDPHGPKPPEPGPVKPAPAKPAPASGPAKWKVDPTTTAADEAAGVLVNGSYIKNPSAKPLTGLVNQHGKIVDPVNNGLANGKYMYVVDESGNIIIGTRAGQRMPHPTLVGGVDPQVRAAGIVEIRGGKIYAVDSASGHFKPGASSLSEAKDAFGKLDPKVFKDFQGYLDHAGKVVLPP